MTKLLTIFSILSVFTTSAFANDVLVRADRHAIAENSKLGAYIQITGDSAKSLYDQLEIVMKVSDLGAKAKGIDYVGESERKDSDRQVAFSTRYWADGLCSKSLVDNIDLYICLIDLNKR